MSRAEMCLVRLTPQRGFKKKHEKVPLVIRKFSDMNWTHWAHHTYVIKLWFHETFFWTCVLTKVQLGIRLLWKVSSSFSPQGSPPPPPPRRVAGLHLTLSSASFSLAPADLTSSFTVSVNLLLWASCRQPPAKVPARSVRDHAGSKMPSLTSTIKVERRTLRNWDSLQIKKSI